MRIREMTMEERYHKSTKFILIVIILLTVSAWGYLIVQNTSPGGGMVMDMDAGSTQMESQMAERTLAALTNVSLPPFGMFVPMWFIMCTAMMLPTAVPMVLAMHRICLKRAEAAEGFIYGPVIMFTLAYCLLWLMAGIVGWVLACGGFQLIGVWIQQWQNLWLCVSFLFLLCGIYQLSPLKNACLNGCQHPLMFVAKHYKPGSTGAFQMGLRHGAECIGCCIALMAVMLPLGMMNVIWMGIFTILMYEEKNAQFGSALGRAAGWILTVVGGILTVVSIIIWILG